MEIGMLWLDDDKNRSVDEKICKAAAYYLEKYEQVPDLCLVNRKMLAEERRVGAILVKPAQYVLVNHFWLGVSSN